MDRASKEWIREYKKLFDEVARFNAGMNATANMVADRYVQAIERIGRVDESNAEANAGGKTESVVRIGKIVDENSELDVANEQDNGGRAAIGVLDNGNIYVIATRKVITGETKSEQRAQITKFFNKLLDNKKSIDIHTIEGDVLTITKADTAKKARDDYKTVNGIQIRMTDSEFKVKLRAEAHIDELAEVSKTKKQKASDTKNHPFAKDGFTYRTAYFEDFDGKYYKITLSIGNNGNVATIYNVGEIKENVSSSAKLIAVTGSKTLDETFSNKSIPQNSEKDNSFDKKVRKISIIAKEALLQTVRR